MSMFQVGDVVVRIAPCLPNHRGQQHPLRKGGFYRVEAILPPDFEGSFGILLEGHRGRNLMGAFKAELFRKIKAPDTEISDAIRACRPAHRKTPVSA